MTPMIGGTLEKTVRRADRKTTNECLSIVRFKDLEVDCILELNCEICCYLAGHEQGHCKIYATEVCTRELHIAQCMT